MAAEGFNLAAVEHGPSNPAKIREIRVGLVMYGGVSLAIYINGVAHEFFRAVHGNGVYKLLKRLIDADIVVDIVSGTSAGGINGIFLGYALANGKRFDGMADLWRSDGDIMQLLRKPPALPDPCLSALDSDRYHDQLRDAFARLEPYRSGEADEPSALQELDLFVTGTDVDGNTYTTFDDSGHPIDVKDHRTVFHLKHRADRKTPFLPTADGSSDDPTHRALARLARLTSCFPAAFQSVDVNGGGAAGDAEATAHGELSTWGALSRQTFFLDGGVLDNKPFSYTTREIFYRTAERPVERYLFYVEPDPEKFDKRKKREEPPNFLESAYAGTIGIPGYESIADDLRLIRDQNAKLQQYRALCAAVNDQVLGSPRASLGKAVTETYRTAKLQQLCRRAVRSILKEENEEYLNVSDPAKKAKRDAAKGLFKAFDDFPAATDHRPGDDTLRDFDIYFHARRIDHLTLYLYRQLSRARTTFDDPKRHGNPDDDGVAKLLYALNRSRKLIEIVQFHMETLIEERQFNWSLDGGSLWMQVQTMLHQLLDVDPSDPLLDPCGEEVRLPRTFKEPLDRRTLDAIHKALTNRRSCADGKGALDPNAQSALRICDQYLTSAVALGASRLPREMADRVRAMWDRFEEIDALVFPLQLLSGVNEIAEIRTVRISPVDAIREFSKLSIKDKLAGDDLGHFSGFFRKSWRSNDIMWGRLDAVCQLTECFLSQERLDELLTDPLQRAAIRARLVSPNPSPSREDILDFVARIFTNSSGPAHAKLAAWVDDLLSPADDVARAARDAGYEAGLNQLIAMAQLDIICEDVPRVFADEEEEMLEWANVPSMTAQMSGDARKAEMQKKVDASSQSLDADPKASAMGRYFRDTKNGYKVGSEGIEKLPPTLLLEILASALLVTKFAIISSLPKKVRNFIELNPLYRFCIDWPLRIARGAIIAIRREHRLRVALVSGLVTASVLSLIASASWPKAILYLADHLSLLRVAIAVVLPLFTLSMITRLTIGARLRSAAIWAVALILFVGGYLYISKNISIVIRHKGTQWTYPSAATPTSQSPEPRPHLRSAASPAG